MNGSSERNPVERDIQRDAVGVTRAGIFFAVLGVIGSIGAWFIMIPVFIIVLGVTLAVGASPKLAAYKTLSWAGTVMAVVAVIGLAIFAFMFAVCLMEESRGGFH
jgi:4-hydroxybenzoate polyprenyltransferase